MSQTRKLARPTGLPVRVQPSRQPAKMVPPASVNVAPPMATRRGSLVRPTKSALRLTSMARDVKSVQDIASLADTLCIRKTASYSCLKTPANHEKRVQIVETQKIVSPKFTARLIPERKPVNGILQADCQRVLQSLNSKAVRNSSEFDDSVASLLSENMDLLDGRFDISVASGTSEVVDRTPSVEDLPMECEATTPGQVISLSLDTGYQGDGELSRPESRNAESELRLTKTHDDFKAMTDSFKAMTDSDFFTESDADGHDEMGLSRRRDRKAQVIDGTLYGGPSERSQTEDMESSGIYSDLERKPDPPSYQELISQQIKTIESIVTYQKEKEPTTPPQPGLVKSSSGDSSSTILETPTVKVSPAGSVKKDTIRNKMPNRNVESKLKAMLASEPARTEAKPRTPKQGKWDAVMDKIAAGREKQPLPTKFRQVKSKVYQAVNAPRNGSGTASPNSEKARSRRSTRVRTSESSLVSPKSKQARSSGNSVVSVNSTPHSSISDLSVSSSLPRSAKKREGTINGLDQNLNSSSREIKRSRETNGSVSRGLPQSTNVNNKTLTPRRPGTFRSVNTTPQQTYPLKDVNQNGLVSKNNSITSTSPNIIINTNSSSKTKTVVRPSKGVVNGRNGVARVSRPDPVPILRRHLADSSKAVEALGALLNYCTHDLEAFQTPALKRNLEVAQRKITLTEEQVNTFRTSCLRLEEELKSTYNLLNEARSEGANLQLSLESEQQRYLAVQNELEISQASCSHLEALLRDAQAQLNLLQSKESSYQSQIKTLTDVSEEFQQVLTLKRAADESLQQCQNEKGTLEQMLQDRECEIKMLTADNSKLREKISRLSAENKALKHEKSEVADVKEVERCKPLDVKWGEGRIAERSFDQRASLGSERLSLSDNSLLSEVESLRQVLALKTEEVSELHRLELHLKVEADRVPKLLSLVTTLEAKVEDLQSQLSSQNEVVRNLSKAKETLQDELRTETAQKTRLSHKNEELQYKLRVNSEAVRELVRRNLIDDRTLECSSITSSPRRLDDSRPQMVGVVQKSDSVSYMLDMGEDTAEVVSNIVRRAETARSQTLPKKKKSRLMENTDTPSEYYSCVDSPSSSPATTPRRPTRSRACVRLLHSDFATDSIELPREADCEVIEITGSFDRPEPEMSSSTSSNSSSNFDIESEVYAESPIMAEYPDHERLDPEGQDMTPEPHFEEDGAPPLMDEKAFLPASLPAVGEAMVSSDEE